ncbi:RNA 2',3'-cyclic phosphodiesterase [Nitrosomonas sp. Nm166]|uniref:RNA 2',3'-cyclic phosphodiesterase n=1 Tax=Nitrosomonas sp. Nm166 TaxID=1881054 RepID=UPI0008E12B3D|nr:RNA 2',3'-cyclic phosphodiesterase [Nitrosomonas sp. Nm166]SFE73985.1 2'-5' RNA ligase [Nitrosomonas sp. Nm166]
MIKEPVDAHAKPLRVFLALFPNKSVQTQLSDQADLLESICGGRKVKMQHIHLTLLFLGNITAHQVEVLQQAMNNISAKKFELNLEEICYWKQNQIVYIQAKKLPIELFCLVDALKNTLLEMGFLFDERAYKPHITLIRKAIRPARIKLNNSIRWQVNEWSLIQSKQTDNGVNYFSLGRWCLS